MRRTSTVIACLATLLSLAGGARAAGFRLERPFDLAPGGEFTLRAAAAKVTVRGGDGARAVASVTADREDFAAGNARGGSLRSSEGGVEVRVDPTTALEIDAGNSGGGFTAEVPVTVRGRVDRGEPRGAPSFGRARASRSTESSSRDVPTSGRTAGSTP